MMSSMMMRNNVICHFSEPVTISLSPSGVPQDNKKELVWVIEAHLGAYTLAF